MKKVKVLCLLVLCFSLVFSAASFAQYEHDDDPTNAYQDSDSNVHVGVSADESPYEWFDESDSGFGDPFDTDQNVAESVAEGQDGMGDYD